MENENDNTNAHAPTAECMHIWGNAPARFMQRCEKCGAPRGSEEAEQTAATEEAYETVDASLTEAETAIINRVGEQPSGSIPRYILTQARAPYAIDYDTERHHFTLRDYSIKRDPNWQPGYRKIEGDHNIVGVHQSLVQAAEALDKYILAQQQEKRKALDRAIPLYDDLGNRVITRGINANTGRVKGAQREERVHSRFGDKYTTEKRDAKALYPDIDWIHDVLLLWQTISERETRIRAFMYAFRIDAPSNSGRISDPVKYNEVLEKFLANVKSATDAAGAIDGAKAKALCDEMASALK